MSIQPLREVDYRDAEKRLKVWLKQRKLGITKCQEWCKWDFYNRPFWSVWGLVYIATAIACSPIIAVFTFTMMEK